MYQIIGYLGLMVVQAWALGKYLILGYLGTPRETKTPQLQEYTFNHYEGSYYDLRYIPCLGGTGPTVYLTKRFGLEGQGLTLEALIVRDSLSDGRVP